MKISNLSNRVQGLENELKDKEQIFNGQRLQNEAKQSQIDNLISEKQHIQISLDENKSLKEQYFQKSEEVLTKYTALYKEANEFANDKVAIDEIKRDRDERIARLRKELDALFSKYDDVSRDFAALQVQFSNKKEEMDIMQ